MTRKFPGSLTGALIVLACAAPCAAAAPPPSVFVRIEGAGATLLPQTQVQTTSASAVRGNRCAGSSAAGALDAATQGNWAGSFKSSFKDYFVSSILGETATGNDFWTLWINGRSASKGACSTPLAPADHELWFHCIADANFNCTNNPLALRVATVARRGRPLSVSVVQLDGAGHSAQIGGAAISGNGVAGVSDAHGTAVVVPSRAGVITLQAARSGATPSDPVFVCVYATTARSCATTAGGPPVHVSNIRQNEVFVAGPQLLRGTAGPDPTGLTDVSLSLVRRAAGGRCSYYDATSASWHPASCSARAVPFSVGASAAWSYLLPSALPAGAYRLDVIARDGAGVQTRLVAGVSQLDFSVKPRHR